MVIINAFIMLWLIIAVIAVVIDIMTSNILYVLFSVGAIFALIVALFNVNFLTQFSVFGVVSIILMTFIYPIIKRTLKEKIPKTKTMEESYIGDCFTINEDILDSNLIKFKGIYWTMVSKDKIYTGDEVKVVGIEGNKLIIEKLKNNKIGQFI